MQSKINEITFFDQHYQKNLESMVQTNANTVEIDKSA